MERVASNKFIKPAKMYPKYFPDDDKMMFIVPDNQDFFIPMNTQWDDIPMLPVGGSLIGIQSRNTNVRLWGDVIEPMKLQVLNQKVKPINLAQSAFSIPVVKNSQATATDIQNGFVYRNTHHHVMQQTDPIELSDGPSPISDKNGNCPETVSDIVRSFKPKKKIEEDKYEEYKKTDSVSNPTSDIMNCESSDSNPYTEVAVDSNNRKMGKPSEIMPHYNYLLNPNMVIALSELYQNMSPNEFQSQNESTLFDSQVFKSVMMAKKEFIRIKSCRNKKSGKQNLMTKIYNEIKNNTRKKLRLYTPQNPVFEDILKAYIWLESVRVYKTIKLSLVTSFTSEKYEVLNKFISSFKKDCKRLRHAILNRINLRLNCPNSKLKKESKFKYVELKSLVQFSLDNTKEVLTALIPIQTDLELSRNSYNT